MAKKKVKVKALVNLKYDKEVKKIGEELKVRAEDAVMMIANGYIDLLDEMPKEDEENSEEENSGEGESEEGEE